MSDVQAGQGSYKPEVAVPAAEEPQGGPFLLDAQGRRGVTVTNDMRKLRVTR